MRPPPGSRQARLERRQEGVGRAGRRVPTIGEGVEEHAIARDAGPSRQLDHGHDVLVDRVDAARPDEPHEVEAAAPLDDGAAGREQRRILEEGSIVDRRG